MPKAPLRNELVREIIAYYSKFPGQSASQVHKAITRDKRDNKYVSIRKVQQIVAEAKENHASWPKREPWQPWVDRSESPEETNYLLELRRIQSDENIRPLSTLQAKWAKRIRPSLKSHENLFLNCHLSKLYMFREARAASLGKQGELVTDDLDQYLAYKPWVSEKRGSLYAEALRSRRARYPIALVMFSSSHESVLTEQQSRSWWIRLLGLPEFLEKLSPEDFENFEVFAQADFKWLLDESLVPIEWTFVEVMGDAINIFLDSQNSSEQGGAF